MKVRILLVFCFLSLPAILSAQSNRVVLPIPVPTPVIETPKPDAAVNQIIPCDAVPEEYVYISPRKIVEYTSELNRYGSCGYKLEKSNKIPLERVEITEKDIAFFGVMKLDAPHKYEYRLLPAYNPGEAVGEINTQAVQGFYFKASHPFQIFAEDEKDDPLAKITNENRSTYGTVVVLEKKVGQQIKREYRMALTDSLSKEVREGYQVELNSIAAKGFRPVGVVKDKSKFAVVMEEDKSLSAPGEYLILHFVYNLNKKLTELNKSGYRPILVTPFMALLYRDDNSKPNSLNLRSFTKPENLGENQSELKNTRYLMSGVDYVEEDLKTKLLFTSNQNEKTEKYEYKFYKMSDVARRPELMKKYDALRQPPTGEILNGFQNILKEGYKVREIMASKEIYIVFERVSKI